VKYSVKHRKFKGTYRNVGGELGADSTVGAVSAHHLAPNNSELRARNGLLRLVDVSHSLAQVEVAAFSVVHVVDGQQSSVVVGVGETSVVNCSKTRTKDQNW
jgi:hypothetical protein